MTKFYRSRKAYTKKSPMKSRKYPTKSRRVVRLKPMFRARRPKGANFRRIRRGFKKPIQAKRYVKLALRGEATTFSDWSSLDNYPRTYYGT